MAEFPVLKCGSAVQYPLEQTFHSQTQRVNFLDGSTQQYQVTRVARRWKVDLTAVDEQELDALINFVEETEGSIFSFADPVSGVTVPRCVVSQNGLQTTAIDELSNRALLVIEEVI